MQGGDRPHPLFPGERREDTPVVGEAVETTVPSRGVIFSATLKLLPPPLLLPTSPPPPRLWAAVSMLVVQEANRL